MEKLKERIDKMYPNRAEFAKALGVDPSTLSRLLSNGNWRADKIKVAVFPISYEVSPAVMCSLC